MAFSRQQVIDHIIDVYGSFEEAAKFPILFENDTGWHYREEIGCFYLNGDAQIFSHDIYFKTIIQRDLAGFSYWDHAWWRTC